MYIFILFEERLLINNDGVDSFHALIDAYEHAYNIAHR
ncbi:hypothetical protein CPTD_01865 [Corynebacterium pseudotuberculosis]|nr:Hypothetical protein CpE19_1671 [Corynebacterium pseudotuberculosis]APG82362.1 Hypothetical protein CPI37_1732 [Corynebacterium pseudotuberculosis]APQ56826.1 Hypothetical protein CpMEX31_1729 [Corynebacterium pseudotuberculosis]ATB62638.1 Hypothetical protein BFF96_1764 [Corynebacterium pseudotuberculosis]AUY61130.1 Hypothetical protein BFG00_1744 [Corynebacterium pseudotuberculosis]